MRSRLDGLLKYGEFAGDLKTLIGSRQGALTGSIFWQVPVVTIEMVVLSNAMDAKFIKSEAGQQNMAEAIAAGIKEYERYTQKPAAASVWYTFHRRIGDWSSRSLTEATSKFYPAPEVASNIEQLTPYRHGKSAAEIAREMGITEVTGSLPQTIVAQARHRRLLSNSPVCTQDAPVP